MTKPSKKSHYRDTRSKEFVNELLAKAGVRRKRRNAKRLRDWTGRRG